MNPPLPYVASHHPTHSWATANGPAILDRRKWEIRPPLPQINDEAAEKPKHAIFSYNIEMGGGGGVEGEGWSLFIISVVNMVDY